MCSTARATDPSTGASANIWAVVPIKETGGAKQRLAGLLSEPQRRRLALAMAEDVLSTLARVAELASIAVITVDTDAAAIARRYGAEVWSDGAREGHTGAVAAAARRLAAARRAMLALPGDIPLIEPEDVRHLLGRAAASFAIVPAHDDLGSNAVLCAPADIVPLRFGENSFFPHLEAARARGIAPEVVRLPRIALDIDTATDLARFLALPACTRAHAFLAELSLHQHSEAPA
jgi:2-phospho-L-lactate guanylyltransferase